MEISLAEIELSDVDFILELENDTDIWKVSNTTDFFNREEIENFAAQNSISGLDSGQKRWMIKIDDVNCGCVDIFDYDKYNGRAGVGIAIHKDYRGHGIAKIALKLIVDYSRYSLMLNQLYCTIIEDNIKSINIFESLGFIKTGYRKEWTKYRGKYYNELFYQLKL